MAVKIYSDVTKQFYEDEAAALKAEQELIDKKSEAVEARKKAARNVKEKQEMFIKAKKEYYDALEAFCEKYGSYHFSLKKDDWDKLWDAVWKW